jgi:hypothetical protein
MSKVNSYDISSIDNKIKFINDSIKNIFTYHLKEDYEKVEYSVELLLLKKEKISKIIISKIRIKK